MAWTTPGTATAGEVLTAAFWNTNVRDNSNALPRGVLGKASLATAFTTSATHTAYQDTGLTASVTYENNRILRVSCMAQYYPSGGLQGINIRLIRTATTMSQHQITADALNATASTAGFVECFITTASATTETFKVQISAAVSNTAVTQYGDGNFTRYFIVEDIGAA